MPLPAPTTDHPTKARQAARTPRPAHLRAIPVTANTRAPATRQVQTVEA